jgi:hypothetical protein
MVARMSGRVNAVLWSMVPVRKPALRGGPDEFDHLLPVPGVGAVALAHPHAAEPDRRDRQVMSEGPLSIIISRLM